MTTTECSNSVTPRADETPASNRNDLDRERLARAARLSIHRTLTRDRGGKPMKANLKVALVSPAAVALGFAATIASAQAPLPLWNDGTGVWKQ
jgi:hypothetical protein